MKDWTEGGYVEWLHKLNAYVAAQRGAAGHIVGEQVRRPSSHLCTGLRTPSSSRSRSAPLARVCILDAHSCTTVHSCQFCSVLCVTLNAVPVRYR